MTVRSESDDWSDGWDATADSHDGDGHDGDTDDTTLTVADYASLINDALREGIPRDVWVRGEIQGLNERAPHLYFNIVDDRPGVKAQLRVQLFAPQRRRIDPLLARAGVRLENGIRVRITGAVDFWAQGGSIGLKMSDIDPRFTLGDLALQREELIRSLRERGLYDRNRQCAISPAPLRLGVVTSGDSAAWADFRHEIERSGLAFMLRLVDVRVQGQRAVIDIPRAIEHLCGHDDLDAIVLIRGGGSRVDLAAFDCEEIALAIAASRLPVFTGIGHEIDTSVADEVAFHAVKTPTACAAALVERVLEFVEDLEEVWSAIGDCAERRVATSSARLDEAAHAVRLRVEQALARSDRLLSTRALSVRDRVRATLQRSEGRLHRAADRARRVPERLDRRAQHLDAASERLRLLDPVATMARGWSITRAADGRVIRAADDLATGDVLVTQFANGTATSRVEGVNP